MSDKKPSTLLVVPIIKELLIGTLNEVKGAIKEFNLTPEQTVAYIEDMVSTLEKRV